MTFPIKMNVPQYVFTVPSTKEKVSFRPFLVGEQKSMMLSLATEDTDTIVHSIKSLISVCSNGKVDPEKLATFDLEYLFLQLRAKSIGEGVNLVAPCRHCEEPISFRIDISRAEVDFSTKQEPKIQLTESIGVEMRYPTLAERIMLGDNADQETLLTVTIDCIKSVWDSEEFVSANEHPVEKLREFVYTLTVPQFEMMSNFVLLTPSVKFTNEVQCPNCQSMNTVLVEGLENFFG